MYSSLTIYLHFERLSMEESSHKLNIMILAAAITGYNYWCRMCYTSQIRSFSQSTAAYGNILSCCWHCKVAHAEDNSHLLCVWDGHRQVKSDKHAICSGLSWSMRVLDTSVFTSYSMDTVHSRCVMLDTLLFSQTGKGYLPTTMH